MPSAIDITKPIYGTPTTQSVRDNFHIARDEITDLQDQATTHVARAGDTMIGPLILYGPPQQQNEATTLEWVLQQLRSSVNTLIYIGDYDGATDVILSSGQPQFIVGQPLPVATAVTSQYYFTVKTGHASPGIGNQPPEGVTAGTFLISNGNHWINYAMTAANVTAKTTPIDAPPIPNIPGANVYDALAGIGQNFLLKTGGILTGFLTLNAAPTAALHASTKQYVDNAIAGLVFPSEAPNDVWSYTRAQNGWHHSATFDYLMLNVEGGHLQLNSTTGNNQIVGNKNSAIRWVATLGDSSTNADFTISRFNDAGANADAFGYALRISRTDGNMYLPKSLIFTPSVSDAPSITGRGATNPTDGNSDFLGLFCRASIQSSGIVLRGPTYGYANSIDIIAGSATQKIWSFRQDGTLNAPGQIVASGSISVPEASQINLDYSGKYFVYKDAAQNLVIAANTNWRFWWQAATGSWVWDGDPNWAQKMRLDASGNLFLTGYLNSTAVTVSGAVNANYFNATGGGFYVANNTAYGLYRNSSDARWRFIENSATLFTIDPGGNAGATGNLYAGGNPNFNMGVYQSNEIINFSPAGYNCWWDVTTGGWIWNLNGSYFWATRNDWLCYNNMGPVAGKGAYQDYSDERSKADITLAEEIGLKEVIQLNPIRFRRIREFHDHEEILDEIELGFSAQQIRPIIPEAIAEIEIIKSDGGSGIHTGVMGLSLRTTPIVAALVNAIKELNVEIQTLKGQRRR